MKPKPRLVLELCIKQGIDYGWQRAYKYTDTPNENAIKQEIEEAIWQQVWDWFEMENDDA
jgi:hypothetical protein